MKKAQELIKVELVDFVFQDEIFDSRRCREVLYDHTIIFKEFVHTTGTLGSQSLSEYILALMVPHFSTLQNSRMSFIQYSNGGKNDEDGSIIILIILVYCYRLLFMDDFNLISYSVNNTRIST